jgi:hypothetical protein
LIGHIPHKYILKLYSKSHTIDSHFVRDLCLRGHESYGYDEHTNASKVSGILEVVKVTYAERPMFVHGYIEEMVNRMKTAHSCLGNN